MTRTDHKILFTALAFMAIASKDKDAADQVEQILNLAKLIEDFCATYLPKLLPDEDQGHGDVQQLVTEQTAMEA